SSRPPAPGTGARNAGSRARRSLPSGTPSLKFCWKSPADRAVRRAVVAPTSFRQQVRQGAIEFASSQGTQPPARPHAPLREGPDRPRRGEEFDERFGGVRLLGRGHVAAGKGGEVLDVRRQRADVI